MGIRYITYIPDFPAMKRAEHKENKRRGASEVGSSSKLPPVHSKHAQPSNPSLNAVSQQEEGLVSVLHEYFMKNNFMETLESFQRDCTKPLKPGGKTHQEIKKELLSLFDQGAREQFLSRFWQFVPISMRTKDLQTMKMEFYIRLYFFVYSTHPALGRKKLVDSQAKQSFIGYLEGRGASLSKLPEFLQYYALTNVHKPQEHPNFKPLFTKEWALELRKRVAYFLDKLYPPGKIPSLVAIYDRFVETLERQSQANLTEPDEDNFEIEEQIEEDETGLMNPQPVLHEKANNGDKGKSNPSKVDSAEVEALRARIEQLEEEKDSIFQHFEDEKKRSLHWQNTYQEFSEAAQNILMESQTKWFQITQQIYSISDEILGVCRGLQAGNQPADANIVDKIAQKLGKYEKFMKMDLEQMISADIDFSVFERPQRQGNDVSVDLSQLGRGESKLIQLDFGKISDCLGRPETSPDPAVNQQLSQEKILLLQALRWRITKARTVLAKRGAVLSYTLYDILGLKKEEDKTLEILLTSHNENLIMEMIGFVSSLTRDYYGREYLVCPRFYSLFISLFTNERLSEEARMHLLISFQMCSTKKMAQELMIRNGMIRIIVRKLDRERETIPSHYLEYMVALLVNILLHKEGPKKAEDIAEDIMRALINLIESDSMSVRSYVHGSLYPLLSNPIFTEKAKAYGLLENINFLLENRQSEEHHNQLLYLKKKLEEDEDSPVKEEQQEEEEEDNDQDELLLGEYTEQGDEYVELKVSGIKGEELLMKEYLLLGPQSLTQMNKIQDMVTETLQRRSIIMDNSFYERESVSTPVLSNRLRRNISHNNSVYSNRSANRVLRSENNSRTNIVPPNKAPPPPPQEKLDTVPQNNSEVSLKEAEEKSPPPAENLEFQETFRNNGEGGIVAEDAMKKDKPKRQYEQLDEYKQTFQARRQLVRTPPRR